MKTKTLTLLFILMATLSCKNETKAEAITVAEGLELKLNHGEKWVANYETHKGVEIMDSLISAFKKDKNKDYKTLGETLSKQTSYIIKNCSMTGEPHDQLHVVLVPMLDGISTLKESGDSAKSNTALTDLKVLIDAYFHHFKIQKN